MTDLLNFDPETVDLDAFFKRLHLANARRNWRSLCQRAEEGQWSPRKLLGVLVAEEMTHRAGTRVARGVRKADFPFIRTIEDFDFSLQSTVKLPMLGSYLGPELVAEGRNLVLLGKTGRGKTHIALAIAYRAICPRACSRSAARARSCSVGAERSPSGSQRPGVGGWLAV